MKEGVISPGGNPFVSLKNILSRKIFDGTIPSQGSIPQARRDGFSRATDKEDRKIH
jgi:hypothetical protein